MSLIPILLRISLILCLSAWLSVRADESAILESTDLQPGDLMVTGITGTVVAIDMPKNKAEILKDGDVIGEQTMLISGKDASAILVFSNGAVVTMQAGTQLLVASFKNTPPPENTPPVGKMTHEPGVSETILQLNHGEIIDKVKKLSEKSTYTVKAPIGSAGIRGTLYGMLIPVIMGAYPTVRKTSASRCFHGY